MDVAIPTAKERITIAILALGGEGGGVLADWIRELGQQNGYVAQVTSVPGVAQRTGATVYYVEMIRRTKSGANRPEPVLALMPMPGDVDVVIASELMEGGRAILRGFVSQTRTTLISSTHRVYTISEKSALGDGTLASQRILDAAKRRALRFIGFDMAAAASDSNSVISSVMFGALAASNALPFSRENFEAAIRAGGKTVESNLRGFDQGYLRVEGNAATVTEPRSPLEPTTKSGRELKARTEALLPAAAHELALEGVRRLMDYQDKSYAELYLSRLAQLADLDDGSNDWRLTRDGARHLALWMSYEDPIRVADLKIRGSRSARIEHEMGVAPGQLISVTEYVHPRLKDICETLPASLGSFMLNTPWIRRLIEPFFSRGRHAETTRLHWFLTLRLLASMRRIRRSTLRFRDEQIRIEEWLSLVRETARTNCEAAAEILACQQLLKGYSDTFERGLLNFETIVAAIRPLLGQIDGGARIRELREAALADENGNALRCAVGKIEAA